jgi:hypothetical protein
MAGTPVALMQEPSSFNLAGADDFINLILGTSKTSVTENSGGSSVSQTILSPEAEQALVKKMLEADNGLASLSTGEKSAGLYNTTTRMLQTNDLLARIANNVAVAGAPTVKTDTPTTSKVTTTTPNIGDSLSKALTAKTAGMALATMLGVPIGSSLLKKLGVTSGIDKATSAVSDSILDAIGVNTAVAGESTGAIGATGGASLTDAFGSSISSDSFALSGAEVPIAAGLSADVATPALVGGALGEADAAGITAGVTDAVGTDVAATSADAGAEAATAVGAEELVGGGTGATELAGIEGADEAGAIGGSLAEDAAFAAGAAGIGELVGGAAGGLELGGAVGGATLAGEAAEGAGLFETAATAAAAWVICTELKSKGLLDASLYAEGAKHISKLSPKTIAGYHVWAIPYTRLMRRSSLAVRLITPIALARTKHLSGRKNFIGFLTVIIGEPVCYLIGHFVNRTQNWKSLYASS